MEPRRPRRSRRNALGEYSSRTSEAGHARTAFLRVSVVSVVQAVESSGEALPLSANEALDGAELVLVAHLAALADPVAEVDIGEAAAARFLDLPEDVVGAVRGSSHEGVEERIDGGKPVGELVHDGDHPQLARLAELDEARGDVRLQQEVGVLLAAVVVHPAAPVALALVEAVERVVLGVELELAVARLEVGVARERAALRARGLELPGHHPHGEARMAVVAIGAVRERAAAAEARGDQRAVGFRVDEVAGRGDLRARELAGQVAARIRRCRVELQVRDRKVVELGHSRVSPLTSRPRPSAGRTVDIVSTPEPALRIRAGGSRGPPGRPGGGWPAGSRSAGTARAP